MTINKLLTKADHLAAAIVGARSDALQGLDTGAAKQAVQHCRDDFNLAVSQLTEEERTANAPLISQLRDLAEAGDQDKLTRIIYLHDIQSSPVEEIPTIIAQALDSHVDVDDIRRVTGLSDTLVKAHEMQTFSEMPEELQQVVIADTMVTVLEHRLAQARERRGEMAHAAANLGHSWYKISHTVGRSPSTLQRW